MCRICYVPTLDFDHMPIPAFSAGAKGKYWPNGSVLKVATDTKVQRENDFIIRGLSEWSKYGNIHFAYTSEWSNADIRIGTDTREGSYQYVGTDSTFINSNRKTGNLGWLPEDLKSNAFETVFHEGGHIVGLLHEHHRLKFDEHAVYKEFGGYPNYWDRDTIYTNIIKTLKAELVDLSAEIDWDTIMMYWMSAHLTLDGKGTKQNKILSKGDKDFAAKMYPFLGVPAPISQGDQVRELIEKIVYKAAKIYPLDKRQRKVICEALELPFDGTNNDLGARIYNDLKLWGN